jgi:acyl dehydratase
MALNAPLVDYTRTYVLADLIRYSGAAQDFNAIHYDESAATAVGFGGIIAHGMLTLGAALAQVTDITGVGALRAATARFRAPVLLGESVRTRVSPSNHTAKEFDLEICCGGATAVTGSVRLCAQPASEAPPDPQPEHTPVADRVLRVERGSLTRLAGAVGATDTGFYDERRAREQGWPGVPAVPTTAFALSALGWYPEDQPGGSAAEMAAPDAVADATTWAQSSGPVIHAGQTFWFARPLIAGETVRLRQWITERTNRKARTGKLQLTDVTGRVEDRSGKLVQTMRMTLLATVAPAC